MKKTKKILDINLNINDYFDNLQNSEVLLFDIETTGFVAEKSILYLIGCTFFENNSWISLQFFSEKKSDEHEILNSFYEICKKYKYTINFNGETFDIPYLIKKSDTLGIKHSIFDELINIDLYKLVKKFKNFLSLESLKQKSLEKFLGITRMDLYSGGDLIEVFFQYLSTKEPLLEYSLLLHNEEDLYGMLKLIRIMNFVNFFDLISKLTPENINEIDQENDFVKISFNTIKPSPFDKEIIFNTWKITFIKDSIKANLEIILLKDTLYHYFKDYKNYYYSIEKDEAIHKSIGKYLDPSKRLTATSENCYIKKNGIFLETYLNQEDIPLFKVDRLSKKNYINLKDNISKEFICENLKRILNK